MDGMIYDMVILTVQIYVIFGTMQYKVPKYPEYFDEYWGAGGRNWKCVNYIRKCDFISIDATLRDNTVLYPKVFRQIFGPSTNSDKIMRRV